MDVENKLQLTVYLKTKAVHMSYTKLPQAHLKKEDARNFLSSASLTPKGAGQGYPFFLATDVLRIREILSLTQQLPYGNWKTHSSLWALPTTSLDHGQGSSSYGLMGASCVQLFHLLISSLKLAIVGLFTPWKLVNTTNQDFSFFTGELVFKHLPAHHCYRVMGYKLLPFWDNILISVQTFMLLWKLGTCQMESYVAFGSPNLSIALL